MRRIDGAVPAGEVEQPGPVKARAKSQQPPAALADVEAGGVELECAQPNGSSVAPAERASAAPPG
ncbi:hypothetical protein GCM10023238_05030 [Streptomyces heliomycini]